MRENTETKQGSTVDVESASSQETRQSTYVSSCRRFRSRESSAAYSEAMMSHQCLVPAVVHLLVVCFLKFSVPHLFTNTSVQPRRGQMNSSWTWTHFSSPRSWSCQRPRCQGDQGANVPCIAGGCVLTKSDDDHGEIQRQHLSSFCTKYCYFILLVLDSNQSCLTRLTIGSKD